MAIFTVSIDIQASPDRVWAIMLDVERWHEWTPSIVSIRLLDPAPLAVGSRARIHQPKFQPAVWTVTVLDPHRQTFTWITSGPGYRVEGCHTVEPAPGGSRVTLSVEYSGLLAPLLKFLTRNVNQPYLNAEAQGLKKRSEASAASD